MKLNWWSNKACNVHVHVRTCILETKHCVAIRRDNESLVCMCSLVSSCLLTVLAQWQYKDLSTGSPNYIYSVCLCIKQHGQSLVSNDYRIFLLVHVHIIIIRGILYTNMQMRTFFSYQSHDPLLYALKFKPAIKSLGWLNWGLGKYPSSLQLHPYPLRINRCIVFFGIKEFNKIGVATTNKCRKVITPCLNRNSFFSWFDFHYPMTDASF